jgi:uncharacterized protein (UPF0332 family)
VKTPYHLQLLTIAQFTLQQADHAGPSVSAAAVRRSVSTAYYAAFHHFVSRAVGRLSIGQDPLQRAMRASAARWPNHGRMKMVCQKFVQGAAATTLPEALRQGWPGPSKNLLAAAQAFIWLQEKRHQADYNLDQRFTREDAVQAIQKAEKSSMALAAALGSDPWAPWFLLLMMADEKSRA